MKKSIYKRRVNDTIDDIYETILRSISKSDFKNNSEYKLLTYKLDSRI